MDKFRNFLYPQTSPKIFGKARKSSSCLQIFCWFAWSCFGSLPYINMLFFFECPKNKYVIFIWMLKFLCHGCPRRQKVFSLQDQPVIYSLWFIAYIIINVVFVFLRVYFSEESFNRILLFFPNSLKSWL